MRRFSIALLSCCLAAVALTSLTVGCGGKKDDDEDDAPRRPKRATAGPAAAAATLKPVVGDYSGTITGKVELASDADLAERTASLRKDINSHSDSAYCSRGEKAGSPTLPVRPFETEEQEYRVGKNKGLGNVFVWIEPESAQYHFAVPQAQVDAAAKEVTIGQPHCAFLPHCSVAFPSYYKDGVQVKTGQKVVIENDARVTHNAKVTGGPLNPGGNRTLAEMKEGGTPNQIDYVFKPEKNAITVGCDVHKWMQAYVRVYDHPYAAITSVGGNPKKKVWEDEASPAFGTYTITGVPVGAKVKLFAWHERSLWLTPPSGEPITLAKETKKDFSTSVK